MAAMALAIENTITRMRFTLMPARRAASALPPTANTWRPNRVRETRYCMPTTKPIRISTASGTPRSLLKIHMATATTTASTPIRTTTGTSAWSASPALTRPR